MRKKLILLTICLSACVLYAENLENSPLRLSTSGATVTSLFWKQARILRGVSLFLQNKNGTTRFNSGKNEGCLASIKDFWFISFRGEMEFQSKPALNYEGSVKLLNDKDFAYELKGEFLEDFEGGFALAGWIDCDLFKDCGYECKKNGKWEKGIISSDPGKAQNIYGFDILKVFTKKGFLIVMEKGSGEISLHRWPSKRKDQPFRLTVKNGGQKEFSKNSKFKMAFTIKVLPLKKSDQTASQTQNRKPIEMAYFSSASMSLLEEPAVILVFSCI